MSDDWNGDERRGIQVHIINYVNERLKEHNDVMVDKIDKVESKVDALQESISSWMDKQDEACVGYRAATLEQCEKLIDEAIPTHPDNQEATPAEKRREHRKAHANWIKRVEDEMDSWKQLRQRIREWVVIGGLGILFIAVWQYLLQGPK